MIFATSEIVSHSSKSTEVNIVKLFVALPTNQSKYILLPARNEKNITWHGKQIALIRSFSV